jgi:3-oxoacyl-[acyl-carrier protein] reductase
MTDKEQKKTALITGASKGIGAAIAIDLARAGFDIWLNYRRDNAGAQTVAKTIEELGVSCTLLQFDVANEDDVKKILGKALEEKTPFVLVNNAGITRDNMLFWMESREWKDVLDVHLSGFFHVTRLVIGSMIRQRQGRIVNIVSTSGQTGMPGQTNYSAAKAGLIGATKSLAREVAGRNILVNAVSPGFIETEMTRELPLDKILPAIPLGRIGTVQEVASVVTFLCSESAGYITGQVLSVNGGVYM